MPAPYIFIQGMYNKNMNKKKNYSYINPSLLLTPEKLRSALADIRIAYQKYREELKQLKTVTYGKSTD